MYFFNIILLINLIRGCMNSVVNNSNSPILSCCDEILLNIFSNIEDRDLVCRVSRVCKSFLRIGNDEGIWKERSYRLMGKEMGNQFFIEFGNWKIAHMNFTKMKAKGMVYSPNAMRDSQGNCLKGQFWNGMLHGFGKRTSLNIEFEGEFKNGKLNGPGKRSQLTLEGVTIIDEGVFTEGQLNGPGKQTTDKGVSQGNFVNGLLHGPGTFTNRKGEKRDVIFNFGRVVKQGK